MGFVPHNKLTARRALDQITTDATGFYYNGVRAVEGLVDAASKLSGMQADWQQAIVFINQQAAANPTDVKWQELKSDADMLVADFGNMRDQTIAVRDAAQAAR